MNSTEQRFADAAGLMNTALDMCTGLRPLERKQVTYWSLATHMLPHLDVFPILSLKGPMSSGKSRTLGIASKFAYKPHKLAIRDLSPIRLRDEMANAYEGTIIGEEADKGWQDLTGAFETLLSDRYARESSNISVNVKTDRNTWAAINRPIFGATALHRRIEYADAAVDGRCVSIKTQPDYTRRYATEREIPLANSSLIQDLIVEPVEIQEPELVASRIFDSYRPLVIMSAICCDLEFASDIIKKLKRETRKLKLAQLIEPDGLVLRAVINIMSTASYPSYTYSNIKLVAIVDWIKMNHHVSLSPRAVGGLARDLGFMVKEVSGVSVVVPSAVALTKACLDLGYEDSETEKLWRQIPGLGDSPTEPDDDEENEND